MIISYASIQYLARVAACMVRPSGMRSLWNDTRVRSIKTIRGATISGNNGTRKVHAGSKWEKEYPRPGNEYNQNDLVEKQPRAIHGVPYAQTVRSSIWILTRTLLGTIIFGGHERRHLMDDQIAGLRIYDLPLSLFRFSSSPLLSRLV